MSWSDVLVTLYVRPVVTIEIIMSVPKTQQGFRPVLENKAFRRLWGSQALAQTAQNAIHFVLIVLIERLTGASVHLGLMILAFTLPAIIFAPISGVLIDRYPKKWILVGSNALRVITVLIYLVVLSSYSGETTGLLLITLYALTFTMSAIGQFFNPAETATIPMLVGQDQLMAANSLFNLTLALSQVIGLIILGPLAVKLIGVDRAFVLIAGMYLVAAILVSRLPKDEPATTPKSARSGWESAWAELKEGWEFVLKHPRVKLAMTNLTLIASLVMVLAMLAPGIASRVLHLAPEDAIVVFAPAGLGMLVAAILLGRWGYRMSKRRLTQFGLAAMVLGFAGFGWVSWRFQETNMRLPLDETMLKLPPAGAALILATIFISFFLGLAMSGVNIVSQTSLHENTTERVRGRVFAVQFMLNNLAGIPPMLAIGALADVIGIPQILLGISLVVLAVLIGTTYYQSSIIRQIRRPAGASARKAEFVADRDRESGGNTVVATSPSTEKGGGSAATPPSAESPQM
ncbi:MAG: MFS transporter [Chloroflexota bacterium]|nr:MFS transporter [Chloroflexota bacterium]